MRTIYPRLSTAWRAILSSQYDMAYWSNARATTVLIRPMTAIHRLNICTALFCKIDAVPGGIVKPSTSRLIYFSRYAGLYLLATDADSLGGYIEANRRLRRFQRVSLQQPHVAHPKFSFVDPSSLPQRICPLLSINTTVKMKVQSNSALARLLNILRFKADFGLGVVAHLALNLHISRSSHLHIPIFYPHLNAAPSTHQQSISEATSSYSIQPLTPHVESLDIPKVQLSIGYEVEQLGGNPPVTVEIDSCSPQCSPASVPHRDFELVSRTSTSHPSSSLSAPSGHRNSASIDSVSPTLAIIPSHDSTADVSSSLSNLVGPSSQKDYRASSG
ncbi:hypothetical protein A0H81_04985 [Grifola frondosa]|uniref:Uncharacterized protein n=1 Tax=Grifola frondosa TaxID=5627 RepID=A0A1C7MEE0_GRIFR|nr:hypothetical protein A0H81_04985 [Grifola frondosa]